MPAAIVHPPTERPGPDGPVTLTGSRTFDRFFWYGFHFWASCALAALIGTALFAANSYLARDLLIPSALSLIGALGCILAMRLEYARRARLIGTPYRAGVTR